MSATFPQITSPPQASAEVIVNEAHETLEHQAVYGKRQDTTTGLTWGYYGGRWGGFSVAAGTFTLTNNSANYIVVALASGVTTCTAANTNWNNTTSYARVYKVTTASSVVTAVEDHRSGPGGVFGGSGASGVGDALVANPLSQFAATTSAQLAGVISDETGSGLLVFGTAPTLSNPVVGTQSAGNNTTLGASTAFVQTAVGAAVAGLSWKQAVRAATTANGTLATAFENGDLIDNVTLATGDRILVKNQAAPAENGIYVVAASGAPTRATDADSGAELVNATCYVSEGATLADTQWTCTTNATITVNSTSLAWAQLSTGSGTVTTVSVTTANGVSGTVATATTTPAITLALAAITPTTVTPTAAINEAPTVTIASSTTPAIFAAAGNTILLTGTTTVTGFDTIAAGAVRRVRFDNALLLTYNATSLILPTSANITTAADDVAVFLSLGSGNSICISYSRKSGAALAAAAGASAGLHSIPIVAGAMRPSFTGGCAGLALISTGTNTADISSLDFDPTTEEYAQFIVPMPKSWNEGTITAKFIWSHGSTATNFGVVWGLQGYAISDTETIGATFSGGQTVTDTGATGDVQYTSAATSAITILGTPAAEDVVYFRVYRKAADGSDTLAVDARLIAVVLYITTDAETDA